MLTGILAFVFSMALLTLRPDILATYHYNQYVVSVTHLVVLGWISTIVMGAMYQLVPVALETKLYSERLARWQFLFHAVGFIGMVWMFWKWDMKQVGHFGSLFACGVGMFVYNMARTLVRVPRWNYVAGAVTSALVWLCLAITAGLMLAAAKSTYESAETLSATSLMGALVHSLQNIARAVGRFDQFAAMHAHAHLGAAGVFVMLIIGISYKLVPMFALSEVQKAWRAKLSLCLLNAGLAGAFISILIRSPFKILFSMVMIAGLVVYAVEMTAILKMRKRVKLDWGMKAFITAMAFLAPVSVLAVVLSWPGLPLNVTTGQLENLYGFLGLIGVISFAIVGMLHKIIPFLVWFATYSTRIGIAKVPSLSDLYSARIQVFGYWTYLAGLVVCSIGIIPGSEACVRAGGCLILVSVLSLAANVGIMVKHRFSMRQIPTLPKQMPPGGQLHPISTVASKQI